MMAKVVFKMEDIDWRVLQLARELGVVIRVGPELGDRLAVATGREAALRGFRACLEALGYEARLERA